MRRVPFLLALAFSSTATGQTLRPEPLGQDVGSFLIAVDFAPGVPDTAFCVEKSGLIKRFVNGQFEPAPFLDITDRVQAVAEGGLLGLVFHPDFQSNGFFYVSYTDTAPNGNSVVSRFSTDPMMPDVADPNSETILFGPFPHVDGFHKAGDLEFGPDGMLYFSMGDGDGFGQIPGNVAQDLSDARGSILRFDVDAPFPHVPADNPFVATPGANPLIWAYGLRNPFRFDIDPITGDLYTGDVGGGDYEEVNRLPGDMPGQNLGWRCLEGPICLPQPGCTCPSPDFRAPIATLEHSGSSPICAVVGGLFVRDGNIPGLDGTFLFTDYCSGFLYAILDPAGDAVVLDLSSDFRTSNGQPVRRAVDFVQSPAGEIFFVTGSNGRIWKLAPPSDFGTYCSTNPNSTGASASIEASGSNSIGAGNLVLEVTDLPTNAFGIFLVSRSTAFGPLQNSDGSLCVGAPIFRWSIPPSNSGALGTVTRTSDLTDLPSMVQLQPGETWFFQYWTRDANPMATSNTSNGASVLFVN